MGRVGVAWGCRGHRQMPAVVSILGDFSTWPSDGGSMGIPMDLGRGFAQMMQEHEQLTRGLEQLPACLEQFLGCATDGVATGPKPQGGVG